MKVALAAVLLVGVTTFAIAAGEKITVKYDLGSENPKWKFVVGQWVFSVFQMDDPTHFRKLSDVPVEPRIHSLVVDPRTHRVYAPAEQVNGRPASTMFVFEAVTD